jgi:hypothetical protein
MDRFRSLVSLFAALVLTGWLAAACDSGTQEPAAPEGSDAAAPATAGDTTAMGVPGADKTPIPADRFPKDLAEGVIAGIPDNFPEDLPIYPGSQPAQGKQADVHGVGMSAVQLLTVDPPEMVFDFYMKKLESDGWKLSNPREVGPGGSVAASNGSCNATLLVGPASDGSGSDIFLISECS